MCAANRDTLLARGAVLVVGACAVVLAATLLALSAPALAERLGWTQPSASYVPGDRIDLDSSAYSGAARTIFIFSRFSCGACQQSKPTMAAIAAGVVSRSDVHVVLVTGPAPSGEEQAFARDVGVEDSRHLQVDLRKLRLRYVPAAVLTDASGTILLVREGLLTESDLSDIVQMAVAPFQN